MVVPVQSAAMASLNKRYNPPKMKFDTKIWHPNISSQAWPSWQDMFEVEVLEGDLEICGLNLG